MLKLGRQAPSLLVEYIASYNIPSANSVTGLMINPVLKQQQHYQSRLQDRLCKLLEKRIALKRWEFQHTAFDPLKLWKIANEVEALNWVLKKVQILSDIENTSKDAVLDRIVVSLKKELLSIERYLCKPSKADSKFSKRDRLKSRVTAIEWSLFQMHFLLTETFVEDGKC